MSRLGAEWVRAPTLMTWTPVSGAFYNAQGAVIGSYGRAADGDMRMLAFTFFHLSPDNGCLGS